MLVRLRSTYNNAPWNNDLYYSIALAAVRFVNSVLIRFVNKNNAITQINVLLVQWISTICVPASQQYINTAMGLS